MATLQTLVDEVTALKTVDDSVVALLTSLHDQLAAALAANDPAAIQAIVDSLDAEKTRLAAAVTANTPPVVQPPPPADPNAVPPLPNP